MMKKSVVLAAAAVDFTENEAVIMAADSILLWSTVPVEPDDTIFL